ncbi:MAG: polysulfide reductase NrfD [Gallionella sp.]|nr:polysulfide reductase NrfD [Gallionella sp.]PIR09367.1 MAG: molybdopterin oxidoreductase [Gallionellaceae bacterium CG11_big_fil_rev_8_21_14_0_20_60_62]
MSYTSPNQSRSPLYNLLLATGLLIVLGSLLAVHEMESQGHIITGMNNQIVWGLPHVFAIFLIVAASGVLNVSSIGSVFNKPAYKARGPLAGLLSIAMLGGGLMVLMLDLGRPDRVIVAATNYNPTSVFAWNVLLYSGMFAAVVVYLWTMMEKRMYPWSKPAGLLVFVWRFVLTTGTGLIFAFLGARQAYGSAILPPMFIILSFAWGLAVFHIVQSSIFAWNGIRQDEYVQKRMRNLMGVFVVSGLYFVVTYHLTNFYFSRQSAFEYFILRDGGIYPQLFWWGYIVIGNLLPLLLIFHPALGKSKSVIGASLAIILGGFAFLYVFIIGGQAFPLDIFHGYAVSSTFGDGEIAAYRPSVYEALLGLGGLGVAFMITAIGIHVLNFVPREIPTKVGHH